MPSQSASPARRVPGAANALSRLCLAVVVLVAVLAAPTVDASAESGPPLKGVFAENFTLSEEPVPAPEVRVVTPDGEAGIGDFEGGVVLVNFWATWCAPCVREMPSLDRLQAALGPAGLTVMAVSEDNRLEQIEPFYAEHGLDNLGVYLDQRGALARAFKVAGLPTTILIDRDGNAVGRLQGDAAWDSAEAKALIGYYLDREPTLIKTGG